MKATKSQMARSIRDETSNPSITTARVYRSKICAANNDSITGQNESMWKPIEPMAHRP